MATLNIRREFADGEILFEADLAAICDDVETMFNVTKINDDNIQNQGITASTKLVDASITSGKIASGAIITSKIADANVTTAKIEDFAITTEKLASNAVTGAKLGVASVTEGRIADLNVTTSKIANGAIITSKIAAGAVTTAELGDAAVTPAKTAARNRAASTSSGTFSTIQDNFTDISNLQVTITANGRPILIFIRPVGASDSAPSRIFVASTDGGVTSPIGFIRILRGSSTLAVSRVDADYGPGPLLYADVPDAGSVTYTFQARAGTSTRIHVQNYTLEAIEL